jgi:hypothetical protein
MSRKQEAPKVKQTPANTPEAPHKSRDGQLNEKQLDEVTGGKVTFNPFSITRKIDRSSPTFLISS